MAHGDGREVVFDWNADRRCGVVMVDGQVAARMNPAFVGDEVSRGIAAERLDPFWLKDAIASLLDGLEPLLATVTRKVRERNVSRGESTSARRLGRPSQLEIWTSVCAWAGSADRQLTGLPCPLCGEAMIVCAPEAMSDRLMCPVCASTLRISVALSISLIRNRMQHALDLADDGLPSEARSTLTDGFEQLERLEQTLSGLGSEE
jgi:hypothetical protein